MASIPSVPLSGVRAQIFADLDPFADKIGGACFWMEWYRASVTASQKGIHNAWTAEAFYNATRLQFHFKKAIALLGGAMSSGYRCPTLNALVGGISGDYHEQGAAIDIVGWGSLFDTVDDAAQAVLVSAQAGELGPVRTIIPEHTQGDVHIDWWCRGQSGDPQIVQDSRY